MDWINFIEGKGYIMIYDVLAMIGLVFPFIITIRATEYNKNTKHNKIPKDTMDIAMNIFRIISGICLIGALVFIILDLAVPLVLMIMVLFVLCMTSLSI